MYNMFWCICQLMNNGPLELISFKSSTNHPDPAIDLVNSVNSSASGTHSTCDATVAASRKITVSGLL